MTDPNVRHASCPAATGEARPGCPQFPDGAHRCGEPRDHMQTDRRRADERTHRCTCGEEWTSLTGSMGALFKLVLSPVDQQLAKLLTEYRPAQGACDESAHASLGLQASDTGHDPDCPRAAFARGMTSVVESLPRNAGAVRQMREWLRRRGVGLTPTPGTVRRGVDLDHAEALQHNADHKQQVAAQKGN